MADLATRTLPLRGFHGSSATVRLTPAPPASRLSLRARPEAVDALSTALGLSLPTRPKTSASNAARHALWLGPDEWLVIDALDTDLLGMAAAAGVLHSATDISHRNTAILVDGPGAAAAINVGCPQDLSLKAFPVGGCSRTVFGKAEIVLLRTGETAFRVECWRSFAPYVSGLLAAGAVDASH
jgi:sarcosine oxidase subunit gamma